MKDSNNRPRVELWLQTREGRNGTGLLTEELDWDQDGSDETTFATLSVGDRSITIDGDAWRELESTGDLGEFERTALSGDLEDALREQLDRFENQHTCCGQSWTDEWSCACDDECPTCGADVSPVESIKRCGVEENDDGVFEWAAAVES